MDEQTTREQVQVLQKMQENLQALQKNGEQLTAALLAQQAQTAAPKTQKDMLQAAYALNLCTVSVSQIIDYNDVNFLEREYEAILNNLNLEHMPKDEALLHILKQLLDVITYFRISEGEKELLEKEYQQRMKDAIWSAVPNIGVIAAGGNPFSIAVSLASQVGIGYMNYRREKAKIGLEHERREWELQRSAMEQFNGLRRELFDTAWRLADEYNFPDEYRLTERQITRYNKILLDNDPVRKYERLFFMRDKFEAYPPYWYYLGNAANSVYQDQALPLSEKERFEYKASAKEAFACFLKQTEYNLLREDQLVASCALEYFDLTDDRAEKAALLERAKEASGGAFDVLQLCAMSYLSLGEMREAADLLRHLVNEEYNTEVNAQLLSRLYVMRTIQGDDCRGDYRLLQRRTEQTVLFPMPEVIPQTAAERDALAADFLQRQKAHLKGEYAAAVYGFILKYGAEYRALCEENGNIVERMAALLERMYNAVPAMFANKRAAQFAMLIKCRANELAERLRPMLEAPSRDIKSLVRFDELTEKAFEDLAIQINGAVENMEIMKDISLAESVLQDFYRENGLSAVMDGGQAKETPSAEEAIFGDGNKLQRLQNAYIRDAMDVLHKEEYQEKSLLKLAKNGTPNKISFFSADDPRFRSYSDRHADLLKELRQLFEFASTNAGGLQDDIIAVLDDEKMQDRDILFTTRCLIVDISSGVEGCKKALDAGLLTGIGAGLGTGLGTGAVSFAGGTALGVFSLPFLAGGLTGAALGAWRAMDRKKAKDGFRVYRYKDIQSARQLKDYVANEDRLNIDGFLHLIQDLAEVAKRYEYLAADSPIHKMASEIYESIAEPISEASYALSSLI